MFRIDDQTAVTTQPALPTDGIGSPGYFTGGSPGLQPPTRVRFWWLNMVQEELIAIVAAAKLTLSKASNNQVLTALQALFLPRGQTQVGSVQKFYTPVAGQAYTASLNFTTTVPGVLHVTASMNMGGGFQPARCSQQIVIDGNTSSPTSSPTAGTAYGADQCTGNMTNLATETLQPGNHYVSSIYNAPSTLGSTGIQAVSQSLSFIFVPS